MQVGPAIPSNSVQATRNTMSMISKHIALTITTNEVSDWAHEEFCEYLAENATIH